MRNIDKFWPDISGHLYDLIVFHKDQFKIEFIDDEKKYINVYVSIMSDITSSIEYKFAKSQIEQYPMEIQDLSIEEESYTLTSGIDADSIDRYYLDNIYFHIPIPAHIEALNAFFASMVPISTYMKERMTIKYINSGIFSYSLTRNVYKTKNNENYFTPFLLINLRVDRTNLDEFFSTLYAYYKYIEENLKQKIIENILNINRRLDTPTHQ